MGKLSNVVLLIISATTGLFALMVQIYVSKSCIIYILILETVGVHSIVRHLYLTNYQPRPPFASHRISCLKKHDQNLDYKWDVWRVKIPIVTFYYKLLSNLPLLEAVS